MGTASLFGSDQLELGPCNLYFDTETGGEDLDLGGFDQVTVSLQTQKVELREAQAGDRPADRAISAQVVQITCGLSRANVERLEQVQQGFTVERDTADVVTRIHFSDKVGQRDSDIVKQLTAKKIDAGVETTDPLEIIDFWLVAPMTESVELVFDAASQRYYAVMFECYKSDDNLDEDGNSTYFSSREVA